MGDRGGVDTTFGSVWDAIEDSRELADAMKARAAIMRAVQKTVRGWKLSQSAAAARLGLTQPRLSDLLRGKIDKFSLDALFDHAPHAGLKPESCPSNPHGLAEGWKTHPFFATSTPLL